MTHVRFSPLLRLRVFLPAALLALCSAASAQVVISQVYGGGGNTGASFTHDYVELFNRGAAAVNLTGYTLRYASATGNSWTNNAVLSGSIPVGGYYLIRLSSNNANVGSPLPVTPDAIGNINMSATAGKLALISDGTVPAVVCPLPSAGIVDFVGFGAAANCSETAAAPAPAPSNTTAIFRRNAGSNSCQDTNNNGADFLAAAPVPRSSATPAQACDGSGGGGGGGGGGAAVAAAIFTIQGTGATSTFVGQRVITSGVVTKLNSNGFFIQDLTGDANPATSDGIFVFANSTLFPAVTVGNLVQVTGTVSEFSNGAGTAATPLTQITVVSTVSLLGTGYTMMPTALALPLTTGDSFERFEGMLVRITSGLTVQQNFFQARFGQLTMGVGRHETPTNRFRPNSPQAVALANEQARSRLLLDDGSSAQNTNPTAYGNAGGVPRVGDTVASLTGVLDFGLATATGSGPGLYRLHPTVAPSFAVGNARPAAPPAVGGDLRVAGVNVLNFFTTFTNGQAENQRAGATCSLGSSQSAGNCRGADGPAEFTRQRQKTVLMLAGLNADVAGLMEVQNNGNNTVQRLVNWLNATGGVGTYATVDVPTAGTGTDAIRVAIIYKPARLTPVGLPFSDADPVNNRPTLAQTFITPDGNKFTLMVNHLKSKGSCPSTNAIDAPGNLDMGDGQGCWNATRVAQAARLRTFVAQVQSITGVNDVLMVGDFNAYAQEDPIFELTSNGFVDQIARFNSFGYSYVFDGMSGRLDHAISSASMSPRITGAIEWHINADESIAYDYNLEFKQPACAACAPDAYNGSDPYRASDHDPVLIGVRFAAPNISSSQSRARPVVLVPTR